jgi:hypothetical protein
MSFTWAVSSGMTPEATANHYRARKKGRFRQIETRGRPQGYGAAHGEGTTCGCRRSASPERRAGAGVDEAVTNWLLPQRTRRVARRELMFTLELQTYVLPQDGLVFSADDCRGGGLVGGCLVLPPGRWQMPDAADGRTAVRWLRAFGTQLPRAIRTQRALQEHHPTEPHYYIRSVGVRPALQGQGLRQRVDAAGARALRQ